MSSILDRLNLLVRSNLNDLSDGLRPGSSGPLRDMESSLRDARRQLAELRTNETSLSRRIRELRDKADSWEDRAVLALRSGDEDLAREALIVKNETMREAERLRDQLDDQRAYIRDMQTSLEALEMKIDGARGRLQSRERDRGARRSSPSPSTRRGERDWDAEMRRRMSDRGEGDYRDRDRDRGRDYDRPPARQGRYEGPLAGTDGDFADGPEHAQRAFREFDRMSRTIDAMEAQVDAASELADVDDPLVDPRRVELDRIFDRMEKRKRTDDDLSDLKARFSDD
jgi:phage shock protein A